MGGDPLSHPKSSFLDGLQAECVRYGYVCILLPKVVFIPPLMWQYPENLQRSVIIILLKPKFKQNFIFFSPILLNLMVLRLTMSHSQRYQRP